MRRSGERTDCRAGGCGGRPCALSTRTSRSRVVARCFRGTGGLARQGARGLWANGTAGKAIEKAKRLNNAIKLSKNALRKKSTRLISNEPQPVKRTVKKYKVFPASSQALLAASLSRNPVCTQEQTGSRTYMSEKTAKRNEDNRSLHFHTASFFKFMAANLSFTQFVT